MIQLCGFFFLNFFVFYYSGSQEMLEKYMKKRKRGKRKVGADGFRKMIRKRKGETDILEKGQAMWA